MDWTRTKLVLGCLLTLSAACGDDDGDDDDDVVGDAGADSGPRDAGRDAGPSGSIDAGSDAGNIDGGRDAGNIDATVPGADASRIDGGTSPQTSFFVTSDNRTTGNLGGIAGADQRCQSLATAVGLGNKTWRAYLSLAGDATRGTTRTEARSRIGSGPWYNAKGQLVANDVASLHARAGDADVFLTERGDKVNGQWPGSPGPNAHDILTGTAADGGVAVGNTCGDWTLSDAGITARVGHSDGLGPDASTADRYRSWFSSHESAGCNDTGPFGGAGKIYCFATTP